MKNKNRAEITLCPIFMGVHVDLNFIQLIFTIALDANAPDRYAFFGLRPFFTESFRMQSGCTSEPDLSCSERDQLCSYHQIFSQPLATDPAALKRFQKPSLPFVFDIPVVPPIPNSGSTVELGLTLIGSATHLVAEFVAAVETMLNAPAFRKRAAARIVKVESAGYAGLRTAVMEKGGRIARDLLATLSLRGLNESSVLTANAVTVTVLTPMRLIAGGTAVREISFSAFIRALLRRVSSMAYYYDGCDDGLDYKWLAEQSDLIEGVDHALRWVDWGRTGPG